MADFVCDVDGMENHAPTTEGAISNSICDNSDCLNSKLSAPKRDLSAAQCPSYKRPRLSEQLTNHPVSNGFTDTCKLKDSLSLTSLSSVVSTLRPNFDALFRSSLIDKISSYLSLLDAAEKSVVSLREDVTQLSSRMKFIETSSKELTKLIKDRMPLPAPTNGVGPHRTLSSQAPRLPPPPPLVSAPANSVQINTPPKCCPKTTERCDAASVDGPLDSVTFVLPNPLSNVPRKSGPAEKESLPRFVQIHMKEAIDLTADSILTGGAVDHPVGSVDTSISNQTSRPSFLQSILIGLSQAQVLNTSNPTFVSNEFTSSLVPYSDSNSSARMLSDRVVRNHSAIDASPFMSDHQIFPVSPLPPIPVHPNSRLYAVPTQPVPLLTIAEAAEGVCLQWTISYSKTSFEPATLYEIYSYASSEVNLASVQTHLPWKKVGEVAALPLPMACTLTHVQANNTYYFIVRSIDRFQRYSPWSNVVNAYVS